MKKNSIAKKKQKTPDDYFKHCGDCGRFVERDRWIRKDNLKGYTHALCRDCRSKYDEPSFF